MNNQNSGTQNTGDKQKGVSFYQVFVQPLINYANSAQTKSVPLNDKLMDYFLDKACSTYISANNPESIASELDQIARNGNAFSSKLLAEIRSSRYPADSRISIKVSQYFNVFARDFRNWLRRPADPKGESVPRWIGFIGPTDLRSLFPRILPAFIPGDKPILGTPFELLSIVKITAYGEIWKAGYTDRPNQPPVAIEFYTSPEARSAFKKSINQLNQTADALSSNSTIVQVRQVFPNNEPPARERELPGGDDLVSFFWKLIASNKWSPKNCNNIFATIAKMLAKTHAANCIHGNLRPDSILINELFKTRLDGFGFTNTMTQAGFHFPQTTPIIANDSVIQAQSPYKSPQILAGLPPTIQDDIYALGVIFYQLCAADLASNPIDIPGWQNLLASRGIDQTAIKTIRACISKDSAERPADLLVEAAKFTAIPGQSATNKKQATASNSTIAAEPEKIEDSVFISYRQVYSKEFALGLQLRLRRSGYSVFLDKDGLKSGDWSKTLMEKVDACTDFILLLHPETFRNSPSEQEDWVVQEILRAQNADKNIIPVCEFKGINDIFLPPSLEFLRKMQSVKFESDNDEITKAIFRTKLLPALKSKNTTIGSRIIAGLNKFAAFAHRKLFAKPPVDSAMTGKINLTPPPPPGIKSQWLSRLVLATVLFTGTGACYYYSSQWISFAYSTISSASNLFFSRPINFADIQGFAITPIRNYSSGWTSAFKNSSSNRYGTFNKISGTSDSNIYITTRDYEILKVTGAYSSKSLQLIHKESSSYGFSGPLFNSFEEAIIFSRGSQESNFLKVTGNGIQRISVPGDINHDMIFAKYDADMLGIFDADVSYKLNGMQVSKQSATSGLRLESKKLESVTVNETPIHSLMPNYISDLAKSLNKLKPGDLQGFKQIWVYYPGMYAGSVAIGGESEIRIFDAQNRVQSIRIDTGGGYDAVQFAFGSDLDHFCVVTSSGAVFKRNKKDMEPIVRSRIGQSPIIHLWVSNSGKVYAITYSDLLILE